MKFLDKELWNKSFPFLKETKIFAETSASSFVFPDCGVLVLQISAIREKNVLEVVSNECFSSEPEMTQFPRLLQGSAMFPRMTFMGWGQKGR